MAYIRVRPGLGSTYSDLYSREVVRGTKPIIQMYVLSKNGAAGVRRQSPI